MGMLSESELLSYEETMANGEHSRRQAIKQFITVYNRCKARNDRRFKWGDELELMLVRFDHNERKVRLSLKDKVILDVMDAREAEEGNKRQVLWRPESGSYMLEAMPGQPYGHREASDGSLTHLFDEIEANMIARRVEVNALLDKDESLMCLSCFPRFGTGDFVYDPRPGQYEKREPEECVKESLFLIPEQIYAGHPRYPSLAYNIRMRAGGYLPINIPIFRDSETPVPFREDFHNEVVNDLALDDHIFMDDVIFGNGCCCLQVTLQAETVDESRLLYDQLTPLTPIFLALSAATPIFRGYLSDRDCRWSALTQACDDRTDEERGKTPLKNNKFRIPKSRYDTIDYYLSDGAVEYNDIDVPYDREYYDEMVGAGVPDRLAIHMAHQLIRDQIVAYADQIDQDDATDTAHLENLLSSNWVSIRLKTPPSSDPSIGWRVEFRPMEIQSTPFENSAYSVVLVLISRVILSLGLNLLIPMSKVDENMDQAQKRDAVNTGRFWFRKSDNSCELMSIDEIMNGMGDEYPGLLPLVKQYVNGIDLDARVRRKIAAYIQLLSDRASGRLQTTAQWMRGFVRTHSDYKNDSVVNESICYDLLQTLFRFQNNELIIKQLIGDLK